MKKNWPTRKRYIIHCKELINSHGTLSAIVVFYLKFFIFFMGVYTHAGDDLVILIFANIRREKFLKKLYDRGQQGVIIYDLVYRLKQNLKKMR